MRPPKGWKPISFAPLNDDLILVRDPRLGEVVCSYDWQSFRWRLAESGRPAWRISENAIYNPHVTEAEKTAAVNANRRQHAA